MLISNADPVWENIYAAGQRNRYPWDIVVTFVFRYAPKNTPRQDVRILEVGCGTASNLWFAAREGFSVSGIDCSATAIAVANEWFLKEGLQSDLRVGAFTELDFEDAQFDLVIDRGSLVCVGLETARRAIVEIKRTLKQGGYFLFNPYSNSHTSASAGEPGEDGVVQNINRGTLVGVGSLCFYTRQNLIDAFDGDWRVISIQHSEITETDSATPSVHAEWRVILQKLPIALYSTNEFGVSA